jgi:hypothetical protein
MAELKQLGNEYTMVCEGWDAERYSRELTDRCYEASVVCLCIKQQSDIAAAHELPGKSAAYRVRIGLNPFATFLGTLHRYHGGTRLAGNFVSEYAIWTAALIFITAFALLAGRLLAKGAPWALVLIPAILSFGGACVSLGLNVTADRGKILRCIQQAGEKKT